MSSLHEQAARAILDQKQSLAETIIKRLYAQQPEPQKPKSENWTAKSVRDAGYHLIYLVEALKAEDPALFNDYLAWVKVLFVGLKFQEDALSNVLQCMRQVLFESLPEQHRLPVLEYMDAGLLANQKAPSIIESFIDNENPLADLANDYLGALLRGDRNFGSQLILRAVQQGTSIKDIYIFVFQCTMREIGRLWQINQINVAQEHYCTAATQLVMSLLYPNIFSTERQKHRMVVTCVGGELHEIGARMVADFFEMEGWDTYFLGANTPLEGILSAIVERDAAILAISVTMTYHIEKVTELITQVRNSGLDRRIKIMVGGYPFNISPNLWKVVGADGYARDAQQALEIVEGLVV